MTDDNNWFGTLPQAFDGECRSEKRLRELALLTLAGDIDFDSKIQTFLKLGCDGLRMETGVLAGIDHDAFHVEHAVSATGPAPAGFDCDVRDTLCIETWTQHGTLAIEHVGQSRYRTHPAYARFGVEAYIGAVVFVSGSKYGTVYFSSTIPRADEFTEADREYVRLMALWVGSEIERRQNLHKLENSYDTRSTALVSMARREALLSDIGLALRATLDSDEIERLAAERLSGVLSADRCFFVHFDLDRDYMRFSGETRRADLPSIVGEHKPSSLGIEIGPLFDGGRTLTVDDITTESPPERTVLALAELSTQSLIAVPLFYGGRLEAALCVTMDNARVWTDEEIAIVEAVSAQTRTSIEAVALIRRERRIATTLQEALLPPIPDVLPGLLLAHEYRAALDESSVGGDFYAVYSLDNGCHVLVIGDVSGKGLAAASQVGGLQSMLRYALCAAPGLSEAVTQLNSVVAQHDLLEGFATLFVGIYDSEQHVLKYCNCGHEPPLILSGDVVAPLVTTGPPIGAMPGVKYQERSVQLALGDLIVLYTDGLSEAGSDRRLLLGEEGLAEILTRRGQEGETHEIASLIMADVVGFASGRLRDDACLLVIRLADTSDLTKITSGRPAPQAWSSVSEPPRETPTEEQFRLMVDSVTEYAIFLLDTTGHIVTWNRGAERLKGYSASEIVGKHFSIFYTPEDVQRGHPLDELAIATVDGRYEEEGWRVRKDGTQFWANVVITAVRDSEGVLRGFGKVTRDFTERRRAEQQLRRSEERFRHLVDGVQDYAIFMLDLEGNVASWNVGAERIKGYAAAEIVGKHLSTFYTPPDIQRNHPAQELATAAAEGRYEEEGWRVRKDGTKFWASVVITALRDERGELYGYAKVTRDITERRAAEEIHLQNLRDEISRSFLRDILYSVTEGRLRFCEDDTQLPDRMECVVTDKVLGGGGLAGLRKYTRDAAASLGFPKDREADIVTAASEAAMNAIVHAKTATYSVCHSDKTIQIWISDRGAGIELMKLHRATLERGFTTENSLGHGFWLMLHTCDRLWLRSTSAGTTVVMEQDVTLPEPEWLSRPRELADYLIVNK